MHSDRNIMHRTVQLAILGAETSCATLKLLSRVNLLSHKNAYSIKLKVRQFYVSVRWGKISILKQSKSYSTSSFPKTWNFSAFPNLKKNLWVLQKKLVRNKRTLLENTFRWKKVDQNWLNSDQGTALWKKRKWWTLKAAILLQSRVLEFFPLWNHSCGHRQWALKAAYLDQKVQSFCHFWVIGNGLWERRNYLFCRGSLLHETYESSSLFCFFTRSDAHTNIFHCILKRCNGLTVGAECCQMFDGYLVPAKERN